MFAIDNATVPCQCGRAFHYIPAVAVRQIDRCQFIALPVHPAVGVHVAHVYAHARVYGEQAVIILAVNVFCNKVGGIEQCMQGQIWIYFGQSA